MAMVEEQTFNQLMESWLTDEYLYTRPSRGDIREATILAVHDEELLVDIGAKESGVVLAKDLEMLDEETLQEIRPEARMFVYVLKPDYDDQILVSINMARAMRDWQTAEEHLDDGTISEVKVTGFNKGGLLVQYRGIQGFIPASQVASLPRNAQGQDQQAQLQGMIGQTLPVKVIEVDHRRRRLILSERHARREWEADNRKKLLDELEEGQVVQGTVASFCDFGAFVNLGPMDGLIHISEMSWERVDKASDVLNVGEEIEVYVLSVDRERERIGLSLKHLRKDPWIGIGDKYQEGQLIEGVISNIAKFGAFVSVEDGVEGLIHVSELSDGPITDPHQAVVEGERLLLRVMNVEPKRHRLALSLRQVTAKDREAWYLPV